MSLLLAGSRELMSDFKKICAYLPDESEEGVYLSTNILDSIPTKELEKSSECVSTGPVRDMALILIQKAYRKFKVMKGDYSSWTFGMMRDMAGFFKGLKLVEVSRSPLFW